MDGIREDCHELHENRSECPGQVLSVLPDQNHFFFLKYQTQPTTMAALTAITIG